MTSSTQPADLPSAPVQQATDTAVDHANQTFEPGFDGLRWRESGATREFHGAGSRAVLGSALAIFAAVWIGYSAWAAGRALGAETLSSPALAQWLALAAGPLSLLGLVWIMFGRTRRKEAEQFTRSVVAMQAEARSLEALLGVLAQRIDQSQSELTSMTQQLMQLGDQTTLKLGAVTRELESSTERLARQGESFDRTAESARNDLAVLLEDLPRAEATAQATAELLRGAGSEALRQTSDLEQRLESLSARASEAEETVVGSAQRLVTHLTHIESAGAAAAERVGEAGAAVNSSVDEILARAAETLDQIRSGIESQSAAVAALVEQASAGIGRAGGEAAEALGTNIGNANQALDGLAARLAEQERISQRLAGDAAEALRMLGSEFAALADQGEGRAAAFVESVGTARIEFEQLALQASTQDGAIAELAGRTAALRDAVEQLTAQIRGDLSSAVAETEESASRIYESSRKVRPELEWMREAANEASERISSSASGIVEQQDRLAALLAAIDDGVGGAQTLLTTLGGAMAEARSEAEQLSQETGPALVAAMVQVREAAAHAAERAREAIAQVVPESADQLSSATREALERTIREQIEGQLRDVETVAAKAVEAARAASDRLTQQMLALGQSAVALERHIEQTSSEQREKDSEEFARRVSLLIESMNSAAIDVGKILTDEVDDKAWDSYLKGNRGIFTRRAARLLDGKESRAIRDHYETDGEFQQSVNRYIHDFEAMLRRVLAEREGGTIAVTLMSSDIGKLYAALAQAIDQRR